MARSHMKHASRLQLLMNQSLTSQSSVDSATSSDHASSASTPHVTGAQLTTSASVQRARTTQKPSHSFVAREASGALGRVKSKTTTGAYASADSAHGDEASNQIGVSCRPLQSGSPMLLNNSLLEGPSPEAPAPSIPNRSMTLTQYALW